ncbi:MAG: DUF5320 domain-containing protein [Deltaproteobacteria bacterium]|nr:DUF5320 domain-containing protein [Deltaproteobacteria bacterium]
MELLSNLLSEKQCSEKAGVAPSTLRTYVQCGFLRPIEKDNELFFEESEVASVFRSPSEPVSGFKDKAIKKSPVAEDVVSTSDSRALVLNQSDEVLEKRQLRDEIKALKQERDWLRERLERLEARIEREQVIKVAEMEMMKGLIANRATKKNFWRSIGLPWFNTDVKN